MLGSRLDFFLGYPGLEKAASIAAQKGDIETLKRCIKREVSVNSSSHGYSLLERAANSGNPATVEFLLSQGANVTKPELPGFARAAQGGTKEIFLLFKKYGAALEMCPQELKDRILYAVTGKGALGEEAEGLSFLETKELLLHFIEDRKEVLIKQGMDEQLLLDVEDAVASIMSPFGKANAQKYVQDIVDKVRAGNKPVFLFTGYNIHMIVFGFYKDFCCIINRGDKGGRDVKEYEFFRFDGTQFDKTVVESLLKAAGSCPDTALKVIYEDVLKKIKKNQPDPVCDTIDWMIKKKDYFKSQVRGNCPIANSKPLIFFVRTVDSEKELSIRINEHFNGISNTNPDCKSEKIESEMKEIVKNCHADFKRFSHALREYVYEITKPPKEEKKAIEVKKITEVKPEKVETESILHRCLDIMIHILASAIFGKAFPFD